MNYAVLYLIASLPLVASKIVSVAPDLELHYQEAGEGPPLVFVPGWTMTSKFFKSQLEEFADHYRAIAFDPRSHGESTKTAEGNTYLQHGRDLGAFLDELGLQNPVLVGWSSGAHDVLAYVREHGASELRGVVLVDEPPKSVGDRSKEWVYGSFENYRSSLEGILYRRRESAEGLARWMIGRELDDSELEWIVSESLKTPSEAALSLMVDTMLLDYTDEARKLDGSVPVLYMVRENWAEQARTWLRRNAPSAEVKTLTSHAEHWEEPEVFNAKLREFLNRLK